MLERVGDIFSQHDADAICFTSNGVIKANGELVMGAGIAKAFNDRYTLLAAEAGYLVKTKGNHVHKFWAIASKDETKWPHPPLIFSFPTKNHWMAPSDLKLIERSAKELVEYVDDIVSRMLKIYLTRPGCGLGGLDWEKQVKPLISPILDDRFIILTPE